MKLTTLIENNLRDRQDLYAEHGLSIHIEIDGKNILFDTGKSGKFIDNARKLNIDLNKLDMVIISHGHYDHSGGLKRLINEVNPKCDLYLGDGFFNPKYSLRQADNYEYTGNSFDLAFLKEKNVNSIFIKEDLKYLSDNLFVVTNFLSDKAFENTNQTMFLKEDGAYKKDPFADEIAMGIKTHKGLVLVVGCSHAGIVNILETIIKRTGMKIYAVIGGLHLVKEDDEQINNIIAYLKEKDIKLIAACHCTGKQGETMLRQQLNDKFINNNTGDVLEI